MVAERCHSVLYLARTKVNDDPMANGSPSSDRGCRTLADQLREDDDVFEIDAGNHQDIGEGVTKFLKSTSPDSDTPGFSFNQDLGRITSGHSARADPGAQVPPQNPQVQDDMQNEDAVLEPDVMTPCSTCSHCCGWGRAH